jgi:hypothetical protein
MERTVGRKILYLTGRFGQLMGMSLLMLAVFTAGPLGPSFQIFATGVGVFAAGWLLTRAAGLF